jgi:hypothetical protein
MRSPLSTASLYPQAKGPGGSEPAPVATQVLVENDIARRLGLVLFLVGTLTPSLFEPLFNGRAVEAMLVGPVCRQLTLVGDPLSAVGIRVPLRELVKEATELVGEFDESVDDPVAFMRALGEVTSRPEPGKRLTDDWLERVAEVYRTALQNGLPATDAVATAFPISRSTAGRWVMEARRRGLLGEAIPGRAGELPTKEENDG